jgi:peptidoglycan/LPS O-acetylase OafA/YrhL
MLSLKRVTSSGRFIPEVDGLRFLAITSVVLHHLHGYLQLKSGAAWVAEGGTSWLARVLDQGYCGVPIFFSISGFILALPFASHYLAGAEKPGLKPYYLRRLTRLEPPYLLSLYLIFGLMVLGLHQPARDLMPRLLANTTYLYGHVYHDLKSINPVAWSLEVEVQFYLVAPFLALVFLIRSRWQRLTVLLTAATLLLFFTADLSFETRPYFSSLLDYLHFFLIGFVLADLYVLNGSSVGQGALAWDVLSLAGWALLPFLLMEGTWGGLLFPPALFFLLIASFSGRISKQIFSHPVITTIGGMCYSIYLIHYQLIATFGKFTRSLSAGGSFALNFLVQSVLVGGMVLAVSTLFFAAVERPCMRKDWPRRLWGVLTGEKPGDPDPQEKPEAT